MIIRWTHDPKAGDPPRFVRIGMLMINLPDAAFQRAGFHSPYADKLVRNFRNRYKRLRPRFNQ